jgi:UDP-N-acetylmuramoyl-L-alanyl-D-glutamate--2,6-diaminopimelate ligase
MMVHELDVTPTMSLAQLFAGIVEVPRDVMLTDITLDSRTATRGGLFLACRGLKSHGLEYLDRALAAGVSAVAWESSPGVSPPTVPENVVVLAVPELGRQLGRIADRFFEAPSSRLRIAGVTGTNGKTTTCWLLAQALDKVGWRGGYSGTLGFGPVNALRPSTLTTPDCISVHRHLSDLHAMGVRTLGMEVSSHALAQDRVDAVRFETAVFTNLTRDHLDFHRTMDAYALAKARLFSFPGLEQRVINMGDVTGRRIAESLPSSQLVTAFWIGVGDYRQACDSFVHGRVVRAGSAGLEIEFDSSWGSGTLRSRLIGEFNAENLLATLAVLQLWEVPLAQTLPALESATGPAGRMETFRAEGRPVVVVDYAHSPDSLAKALRAARKHCRGRLWCVFGCGGDRDPGKRPMMGSAAAELADEIILTDDNPRTEDPARIIEQIAAGIDTDVPVRTIPERARAIATALAEAAAPDIVLIAGKGHEETQTYGTVAQPFSDRAEVARILGVLS